ncbi:MAG: DNA repair nucleotidyltransferase, partial [Cytophagaceae bacterium]
ASCQRSFDPSLLNRPVVVLSNNDGCVRLVTCELTKRVSFGFG